MLFSFWSNLLFSEPRVRRLHSTRPLRDEQRVGVVGQSDGVGNCVRIRVRMALHAAQCVRVTDGVRVRRIVMLTEEFR